MLLIAEVTTEKSIAINNATITIKSIFWWTQICIFEQCSKLKTILKFFGFYYSVINICHVYLLKAALCKLKFVFHKDAPFHSLRTLPQGAEVQLVIVVLAPLAIQYIIMYLREENIHSQFSIYTFCLIVIRRIGVWEGVIAPMGSDCNNLLCKSLSETTGPMGSTKAENDPKFWPPPKFLSSKFGWRQCF